MKFLEASPADAPRLAGITAATPRSAAWNAAAFTAELKHPFAKIYKLQDEAGLISAFISYRFEQDSAELTNFAVAPDFLRRGFGRILLGQSLAALKILGVKNVTLEVNVHNGPALSLYESFGFKQTALRKKFYNNTDDAALLKVCL